MMVYDPAVMKKVVSGTGLHARVIVQVYALVGMVLGGFAGLHLWRAFDFGFSKYYFIVGGLLLIGGLAYEVGSARACCLRLQVQTALCQMKIEENTRPTSQQQPSSLSP